MSSFLLLLTIVAQAPEPIPYYDPLGRKPTAYEDFAATQIDAPFRSACLVRTGGDARLVLVLVNAELYQSLTTEISTYLSDLTSEGFSTKLVATSGGRPANLRQLLQVHRDSGLVGAVMVGDLPVAWWESSNSGEDFPLDLFFTDLDGVFSDADGDGKYDTHSGNRAPEIWLGRIYASRLTYDGEVRVIRSFFQRNHAYRTGQLPVPRRGLVYNEVTWYPNDHGMSNLYSDITIFNDENTTTAYHYKGQLALGFEFVHIIAHSSPWVHTFFLAGEVPGGGSIFNFEVPALEPKAAFYFLNACMCGRYTELDNLGNWYLFARPWGLAVIASAELMYGVSDLSTVYRALAHDSCFGESFLKWHRSNYASFLGTCLLGDPTLKVRRSGSSVAHPPEFSRNGSAELTWTEYAVENSNFVNGRPDIGFSQGRIRVVFDSGRKVRSDNFFSSFNGTSFTQPESIAWHEYYDLFSSCCTDAAGRFWVAWQSFRDYSSGYDHFQLFSTYYYNNAWSSVQRIGPLAGYHDVQPALASGTDNRVWCAFKSWRNGQGDIWVSYADNAGTWTTPVRLTSDSMDQIDPCVTVDHDNHPWVFWSSLTGGRWRIQGRTYNSGWQPIFDLDSTGANAHPRAVVDQDGRVWVVWHKWQGNDADIYFSCRDGSNWTPPAPLCAHSTEDLLPDIAAAPDGTVWVAWQSRRNGPWDIYTSRYSNGWTEPTPVTNDAANDYDVTVCTDTSGQVWTAWASDRRGYWNIYAARNPLTGVGGKTQELAFLSLEVYPNPTATDFAVLRIRGFRESVTRPEAVRVYDASGCCVLNQQPVTGNFELGTMLDLRNQPSGVYLIRVNLPGRELIARLLLAR
ncbi:MAG: T9SS type A sorting domain-containing protein [candidate division WOR-3 bacterium]